MDEIYFWGNIMINAYEIVDMDDDSLSHYDRHVLINSISRTNLTMILACMKRLDISVNEMIDLISLHSETHGDLTLELIKACVVYYNAHFSPEFQEFIYDQFDRMLKYTKPSMVTVSLIKTIIKRLMYDGVIGYHYDFLINYGHKGYPGSLVIQTFFHYGMLEEWELNEIIKSNDLYLPWIKMVNMTPKLYYHDNNIKYRNVMEYEYNRYKLLGIVKT